ncbi:hypothetical protein ACFPJ4_13960 [Lysinimonas soli]|uniref:SAF domain-containing protein n=1 Tax=Lysinimonas soli TaxID=1074233 RepID=A0ABW0NVK9_9MICO
MPGPDAAPRRRRATLDPRLVLGVLLVLGSVAGVVGIVSAADRRITVYAAAAALVPGERIDAGDLVRRTVALDGADRLYLAAGDIPSDGLVVTQPIAKGELLPASAVGSTAGVRSTSLVLQLAARVSGAVVPGAVVDLWAATPTQAVSAAASAALAEDASSTASAPAVLVAGATVVRVLDENDGGFAVDGRGSSIEVLVPRTKVARLLEAIADEDALAAVPAGLPLSTSGSRP